ncbi:MAG: universal stress protein [Cytophagales bacterium]|nr:universal stress protein [Cytophaga sp.]
MKTILLPTDFAMHSEKAMEFAIQIAAQANARVIVMHSFVLYGTDAYVPSDMMTDMYQEEKEHSEKALMAYCQKISLQKSRNGQSIQTEYISRQNFAASEILSIIPEKNIDLIIMGVEHASQVSEILGSITMEVVHKAKCPVLFVQESSRLRPFKEIYAALEDVKQDLPAIFPVIYLAKLFHAALTVVHVNEQPADMADLRKNLRSKEAYELLLNTLKEQYDYPNMTLNCCASEESIALKIDELLIHNNPDMLVLVFKKRKWFDALFHKSVIRHLLSHADIPLLIIH